MQIKPGDLTAVIDITWAESTSRTTVGDYDVIGVVIN